MRIGILSQWYDPEPGPASTTGVMARELVKHGHEVHVLTGYPNYPTGQISSGYKQQLRFSENLDGVAVHRVPLYPSHNTSGLQRIANYASFGVSAAVLGVARLPKLDVLWVNYSPITVALPMWIMRYARSTPVICEVADLWPDTLSVAGLSATSHLAEIGWPIVNAWCNLMYRTSSAVVHISPGAGEVLQARGVPAQKLHYIPKAANERIYHPGGRSLREEYGIPTESRVLLYAGAMGAAQNLESLLRANLLLKPAHRPIMLFAGSGTQESQLRAMASELDLTNVRFLGRSPEADMTDLLATADMAYISLAGHATSGITMPSKTQSILAAGRGIIVSGDGDVSKLVAEHQIGFTAAPNDELSIATALRTCSSLSMGEVSELGARARAVYVDEFSVRRLGQQVDSLAQQVTHSHNHHRWNLSARKRWRPQRGSD